jgi:hypothetical protein
MMRDMAISTDAPDDGAAYDFGAVTAEYIAPDLRALAVPLDSLRPMPGNARAHGERDLSAIADSLQAHGQQRPIVVARQYRGTENAIIAGCGTWAAAKRLGWHFIAASWFSGDDAEAAAYSVRDNRTGELSAWNPAALVALQADVDLLALWHDDADLADLLHGAAPVPKFQPEAPAHRLDELAAHCPTCTCRKGATL